MSYSRWSNSDFYTFWSVPPLDRKEPENRDNAIFEIMDISCFTAKELRDGMNDCLEKVSAIFTARDKILTHALKAELMRYIRRFLEDVDEEYTL